MLFAAVPVAPAFAHASLTSSSPQDGATLAAPPAEVVFTFDDALLEDTETISINDIDGNVVASQQVTPTGSSMSVPWPGDLASGTYQVAYRVVSADGHPVTGAITFTIAASPSTSASAVASASATASASVAASASAAAQDSPSSGPPVLALVAALAAIAVGATAVILALARRR